MRVLDESGGISFAMQPPLPHGRGGCEQASCLWQDAVFSAKDQI